MSILRVTQTKKWLSSLSRARNFFLSLGVFLSPLASSASSQQLKIAAYGCQAAKGSVIAESKLAELRRLDSSIPDRDRAISECEAKFRSLRSQEEMQWNKAQEAIRNYDCATAKKLLLPLWQNETFYRTPARDELTRLGNCGQGEQSILEEATILKQAEGAFRAGDFQLARRLARILASRPGPNGEKARDLLQRMDIRELNNKRYTQARLAIRGSDLERACQLLTEIEESEANFPSLIEAKALAGGCAAPEPQHVTPQEKPEGEDQRFNRLISAIQRLLKQGDFEKARERLTKAKSMRPTDGTVVTLRKTLEATIKNERELISAAIGSFYRGQYSEARSRLKEFVAEPHSPDRIALARFFLGATLIAEYLQSGETDKKKKEEGIGFFQQARAFAEFSPPNRNVPPKVMAIYEEASKR